jgi:hypothetical protein
LDATCLISLDFFECSDAVRSNLWEDLVRLISTTSPLNLKSIPQQLRNNRFPYNEIFRAVNIGYVIEVGLCRIQQIVQVMFSDSSK